MKGAFVSSILCICVYYLSLTMAVKQVIVIILILLNTLLMHEAELE